MGNLYHDLATVYEAMYQTFINYDEEYIFYSQILKKHNKSEVLEIGSGTGNLAQRFLANQFKYKGLDYSQDMIAIAKKKVPNGLFLEGDMRSFQLLYLVESALITGRTISYLLKNEEVNATFSTIYNNLKSKGILCFDFIDANQFIPTIANGKIVTHKAFYKGIHYSRTSHWSLNLDGGMNLKWDAVYYKKKGKELVKIGTDNSVIRTFTLNEMEILLDINQFEIKEVIDKPAYAFPTYVIVAGRKS